MRTTDTMALARQERADLLDLLRTLSPAQWATPSLCAGWSVRDVAVHVVSYDDLAAPALLSAFARGGFRPDTVNEVVLARYADLDPEAVVALHGRHHQPRGLTAALSGRIALTDGTIHHQDIRRALGLPRTIPPERLRPVLEFALRAPTLPARKHRRGLRIHATDLDLTTGKGSAISGPGEALLMALAGRSDALDELTGDGTAVLRQRLSRSPVS